MLGEWLLMATATMDLSAVMAATCTVKLMTFLAHHAVLTKQINNNKINDLMLLETPLIPKSLT